VVRAALAMALCAVAARAQAQQSAPGQAALADSITRPFIPGGHWLPAAGIAGSTAALPTVAGSLALPLMSPDGVPYFAPPNGMLLRPGAFVYQLSLHRDTTTMAMGVRTVTVTEAMLGGVASWLIAESRTGTAVQTSDSLYLRRADLTPERWSATIGRAQLAVSFTPDSMFAAVQDYQGRRSLSAAVPPGALISSGMIDRLIEMLPLAPGYRVAATVVQIESGAPRAVPATISVEGEESVALSDATVPCWIVVLRGETAEKRFWVTKDAARVVKSEQWTRGGVLTELVER
jgi:hypothetical protein